MRLSHHVSSCNFILSWVVALLFLCGQKGFAQSSPTLSATVDKNSILIGEQFTLRIKAEFPADKYNLSFSLLPDSIEHFEVVERKKVDTTELNGMLTCTQQTVLTSFDSGSHTIGGIMVNFDPYEDDTTINLFTDSFHISVGFAPADSVQTFHDIKPIIEVEEEIDWLFWGVVVFAILVLGYIIYSLIKNRKRNKPATDLTIRLTPFEQAMEALSKLEEERLLEKGHVKQFHTKLALIFKQYATRKQSINLSGVTTDELLIRFDSGLLEQSRFSLLANALRMGDAVKFAKFIPDQDESEICLRVIRETVEIMH